MPVFVEHLLLALGGYIFHLLKQWLESIKRSEVFIAKIFFISIAMNLIAIVILTYIGGTLPPELYVQSPLNSVILGIFNSSMLSGIVNIKKPADIVPDGTAILKPINDKK